jgi:RNA polymerase sigma-70 factor (ECF subfamily)
MNHQTPRATLFATTRWTVVCEAARGGDTGAIEALEALFKTYWQPLYRYLRRLGKSAPDAEDLVQGFFAHLHAHDGLRVVDREHGRFRAFLLGSLKNYLANEWQREHRQKRGGFAPHLSIDWQQAETGLAVEPADPRSPDLLYDRDWALALLDRVLDEMAGDQQELDFARWKPYLSMASGRVPYAEMAAQFGMTEGAARVAVHRLRKRFRERLRREIARTLVDDALVDDEMRSLFAALSA